MYKKTHVRCEECAFYQYDEYCDYYICTMNLDQDEMEKFIAGTFNDCPYFQDGDEYKVVRKQM